MSQSNKCGGTQRRTVLCTIASHYSRNTIVPTLVTAILSPTASLKLLQNPQQLLRHCSNLTYNLYSTEESEEVILYPQGPCHDTGLARVILNLTLLSYPKVLHAHTQSCVSGEGVGPAAVPAGLSRLVG